MGRTHFFFLTTAPKRFCMVGTRHFSGKFLGIDYALLPNREWDQRQKHKKQPWSNVECFAFGGATVRFASLETSFHAANHTIPPPPSYEGLPHCTKDKNRSPSRGEKPLMITWFLFKFKCKLNHTKGEALLVCFQCVDTLLFASKHARNVPTL